MKNYKELLAMYNAMVDEIKNMEGTATETEITNKLNELDSLKNKMEIAKRVEATKKIEVENNKEIEVKTGEKLKNKEASKILLKLIKGTATVEEEKKYFNATGQEEKTGTKGGYLVPKQFIEKLHELKRTYGGLEELVTKIPVETNSGRMPVVSDNPNSVMTKVEEGAKANISEDAFAQIEFELEKYIDVMSATEELLADSTFSIENIIKMRLAKKSTRTNTKIIIDKLKAKTSPLEATKTQLSEKIEDAIYMLDEAHRNSQIITSTEGVKALSRLKDGEGKDLLVPNPLNPKEKLFKGFVVKEVKDAILPKVDTNKVQFFIGSLGDYLIKFDRESLEFSKSDQLGWLEGKTYLKITERFDYEVADSEAIVHLKWATV